MSKHAPLGMNMKLIIEPLFQLERGTSRVSIEGYEGVYYVPVMVEVIPTYPLSGFKGK